MTIYEVTKQDHELIRLALEVLAKNFDDGIYNHTVGCAILCKNGKIYTGVNCDGIHGSCAEYITMGIAISAHSLNCLSKSGLDIWLKSISSNFATSP